MPGARWKLSTGQQRVPIQLRRQELNPIARGWHEISIHSLIPSSNRSEIPVIRAILIHCIMKGEDVRAEDIIADKMVRMAQGIKEKGKLRFPSTIYKLCKEAGVPLREFKRTKKIQFEKPIIARRMESTRFYNQVREEQREMAKEIQQVKNYQVNQTMVDSARNKAIFDELAAVRSRQEEFFSNHANQYNMIRQEQKLFGKEILDVKKYQMSARQLKDWTRNASARECYTVWAHQQENSNLVEMSSQKIVKQIYDNIDHKRPMFYGLLKSDLPPSNSTPPPSSSNDPQNPPK
ncbi:hypothetical protein PIB30_076691 [Stylosanthes scabra]|uniref:Putative plant transposon protein domain-containing protein n=1 Tax=Stylosanthes scabra TaxID=79078 RepID=A0ABU6UP47_9FABA|nr:hypothetical protein [Stylosanthes scabra]